MKILEASEKHIDELLNLCKNCSEHMLSQAIDQWDEVYPNQEVFLKDIRNHSLFLAVSKSSDGREELIGCIVLNEHQDPEYKEVKWQYEGQKVAVIHRLMVDPQYQGQGIARQLMSYVEELATEREFGVIRLDTLIQNLRAINFYTKRGYEVAGHVHFRKGRFQCFEKLTKGSEPNE